MFTVTQKLLSSSVLKLISLRCNLISRSLSISVFRGSPQDCISSLFFPSKHVFEPSHKLPDLTVVPIPGDVKTDCCKMLVEYEDGR